MSASLQSLGSWRIAARQPHARNFISHSDIWMAILMLYLPPQHFYRNNSSVVITLIATVCTYLFISLPCILVELLIGSFSHGSLTRAYDFNRFARAGLCIAILHQFHVILSGMSNSHKIMTFSLAFLEQNMNRHAALWNCTNPWNTDSCCPLVSGLSNVSDEVNQRKASCSTPLEEFYKHYGNILHTGFYAPSSGTYDAGYTSFAMWTLLTGFVFLLSQLSLRSGIRCVTYLLTIPGILLFTLQFVHCYRQPLTNAKINNLITRRDNFRDEYIFALFMPNLYHANQMMMAGGYLVVLHCCRKMHRTDAQLTSFLRSNLIFLAVCLIFYKSIICTMRHGTIGVSNLMRHRLAGVSKAFERENYRDLFEDSKDWLYQSVFEYIESVYIMRHEFKYKGHLLLLDGASILHPVFMSLGFIGVRVSIFKATCELMFQSLGFSELMYGPWQLLTRVLLPLCILAISHAADSGLCRDYLFPKEPFGYAWCSFLFAVFIPTFAYSSWVQRMGNIGKSLHWRMMQFTLNYKRRLAVLSMLAGLHFAGAQIYKNVFKDAFRAVLRKPKTKVPTPNVEFFFQYKTGVFGAPAHRVFSYSGVTANWVLNDVFVGFFASFSIVFLLLQSGRVVRFLQENDGLLHFFRGKPARCFKYCLEFYLAVMFGHR